MVDFDTVDLDYDCLTLVFEKLSLRDLCRAAQVCKDWRSASREPTLWRSLDFSSSRNTSDQDVIHFAHTLPHGCVHDSLNLAKCSTITDKALQALRPATYLASGLINTSAAVLLDFVKSFVRVEVLEFSYYDGSSRDVVLSGVPRDAPLQIFRSTFCNSISDEGIGNLCKPIEGRPLLRVVELQESYNLTNASLSIIAESSPSLTSLNVAKCTNISSAGINNAISERMGETLTSLDLSFCTKIDDSGLASLASSCKKLSHVALQGCKNITNTGVLHLANGCEHLVSLDVGCCLLVDGSILSHIRTGACRSLSELKVLFSGITCKDFAYDCNHISTLQKLTTGEALLKLETMMSLCESSFKFLSHLTLQAVVFQSGSFTLLKSVESLVFLDLTKCMVFGKSSKPARSADGYYYDASLIASDVSLPMLQTITLSGPPSMRSLGPRLTHKEFAALVSNGTCGMTIQVSQ